MSSAVQQTGGNSRCHDICQNGSGVNRSVYVIDQDGSFFDLRLEILPSVDLRNQLRMCGMVFSSGNFAFVT